MSMERGAGDTWAIQVNDSVVVTYGSKALIMGYASVCLDAGEGFCVWRMGGP